MLPIETFARACVRANQDDLSLLSPPTGGRLMSFRLPIGGDSFANLPSSNLLPTLLPDLSDTVGGISNDARAPPRLRPTATTTGGLGCVWARNRYRYRQEAMTIQQLFGAEANSWAGCVAGSHRSDRQRFAVDMTKRLNNRVCLWCGKGFTPRRDGGKAQRFCRSACRRDFDAAGRRWVAAAIGAGVLTVDALNIDATATRALVPAATSPVPVGEAPWQHSASEASRADSPYTRQRDLETLMAHAIAMRRR